MRRLIQWQFDAIKLPELRIGFQNRLLMVMSNGSFVLAGAISALGLSGWVRVELLLHWFPIRLRASAIVTIRSLSTWKQIDTVQLLELIINHVGHDRSVWCNSLQ